jgi:hypothetical protein
MISIIFFTIAAILNAAMDMMFNNYETSIFTKWSNWFNPYKSWVLKWKNGDRSQGERFFGSSTFLVWLTDGWHLVKLLFLGSIILSIYFFEGKYLILSYPLIWFIGFELTRKILTLKNK